MAIEHQLADCRRCVLWRNELRDGRRSKVPYQGNGRRAKANDPLTWTSLAEARRIFEYSQTGGEAYDGIGFTLGDLGNGRRLVGIDLDDCRDPATGAITPWAATILAECQSYAEISPSGTGIKIFGTTSHPDLLNGKQGRAFKRPNGSDHAPGVEVYVGDRYFAYTARRLEEAPDTLLDLTAGIERILALHGPLCTVAAKIAAIIQGDDHLTARWLGDAGGQDDESRSAIAMALVRGLKDHGCAPDDVLEALKRCPAIKGTALDQRAFERMWSRSGGKQQADDAIRLAAGKLPATIARLHRLLADNVERAAIFVFAGRLMQPVEQQRTDMHGRTVTLTGMVPVGPWTLAVELGALTKLERFDGRSEAWVACDLPEKTAQAMLETARHWKVPVVRALSRGPILRSDGAVVTTPGFDRQSGILLCTADLDLSLPACPTREDALTALVILRDAIREFPFKPGSHDKKNCTLAEAVALALLLTAALRSSVSLAPMFAIDAHTMGSGKSTLVDLAWIIATGSEASVIHLPDDAREADKRLDSALFQGDFGIAIDNVSQGLRGDKLCQILTQPTARIRPLGKTQLVDADARLLVSATGNNLTTEGELIRRVLQCSLARDAERPWEHRFERVDLAAWAKANRAPLLRSALIIVLAWRTADCPRDSAFTPFNTYADWADIARHPLIWLGLPDPCLSLADVAETDPVTENLIVLHQEWGRHFNENWTTASEVVAAANEAEKDGARPILGTLANKDLHYAIAGITGPRFDANALGYCLRRYKNRIVAGRRLECRPGHPAKWRVAQVGDEA